MAATANQRAIATAFGHLGRFAFYRRDNPFITSRATFDLSASARRDLEAMLDGTLDPKVWCESDRGRSLLGSIRIGAVPRDLQIVSRDDADVVAVKDVFAFFHARLFWWLVSFLWTIEVAPAVDPLLGEGIRSYRFRREFLEDAATSGTMFHDQNAAHTRFRRFPAAVAKKNPGELFTSTTFDLRAFYYSVESSPAAILSAFFTAKEARTPRSRRLRVLNVLMEMAHQRYAELCAQIKPRGEEAPEGGRPLPLGPPSSQLLANMVMSLVHDDLRRLPGVVSLCSYVDDTVLVSKRRPDLDQAPIHFLADLGVLEGPDQHHRLAASSAAPLCALRVNEEKCGTSFFRQSKREPMDESAGSVIAELAQSAFEQWEVYVEGEAAPRRPGPSETVLHAPLTRERVPQHLKEEILELLEEVRIGMSGTDTREAYNELIAKIDRAQFIRLRPHWADIAVIALAAQGVDTVRTLTGIVRDLCETLEPPPGSTAAARRALLFGLRESWRQSLAQALAVATTASQRTTLVKRLPRVRLGPGKGYLTKSVVERAMRIRRRQLVPREHVAVPLAEFSPWRGKLIGPGAFVSFLEWARERHPDGQAGGFAKALGRAVRFIRLHEACLAIHLWAGSGPESWIEETFAALAAQPLIHGELVEELREKAVAIVAGERVGAPSYSIRIAMPSVAIAKDQLEAVLSKDSERLWKISSASQRTVKEITASAGEKKANLLVLPEWSVMAEQLSNLMAEASTRRMLVIAGQAPEVAGGKYWNRLWTGIPLHDDVGHRACLVPPPRQKSYLSPEEQALIEEKKDLVRGEASKKVQIVSWRGMLMASILCFEFADLGLRQEVRFKADILTVSSLNHDWHYFDAIQEATTRDNYCLMVCVNTATRPGTRIARPTRHEMMNAASIHGSDDLALITRRVDMAPIVAAQVHQLAPKDPKLELEEPSDDARLEDYKPFPPV